MSDLPRQKLARSQKTTEWKEKSVKAIIDASEFGGGFNPLNGWRATAQKCYEYYNGLIDDDDYEHVTKPYGRTRGNMPAKLRNYPIIKPVIDLLLGEKKKRPINTTVGVLNPDVVTKRHEQLSGQLETLYQKKFAGLLQEMGMETGIPPEETQEPQEVVKAFNTNYRDTRAIRGQQGLDYILSTQEVPRKMQDGWKDFLICGRVFSERSVIHDEPHYDILNPLQVDYAKDSDTDFIEDGAWAAKRRFLSPSRVLDEFYDLLSAEDVRRLDEDGFRTSSNFFSSMDDDEDEQQGSGSLREKIEVITVYWKSMERVGFIDYLDPETGEMLTRQVEDGYSASRGEKVKWIWRTEVWKGTRIGDDLYVGVEPLKIQRRSMDSHSRAKLPINGRRYSDRNAPAVSLVLLMIPYQLQYNVYKYRLDLSVAKSKDVIAVFDIGLIPTEKGFTMDTWLYHVEATGIAWVDYSKEGIRMNPTQQTVLDMTMKTMESYIRLLESIVMEMERMTGVTRQRQGQTGPYELNGTTEQSIVQSSHITEDMFARFGDFERRDLQGLLDVSKEAWINGKKTAYILPDLSEAFFEIDGMEYAEAEYGITVTDSFEERQRIEQVRSLGQSLIQAGAPLSSVVAVMEAHSMPQLKAKIAEAEAASQKLQQAQQQAEQQAQQGQMELEQAKMQNENDQKEKDRQNKLQIALMQAESARTLAELNADDPSSPAREENLERMKLDSTDRREGQKIQLQRETVDKTLAFDREKLDVDAALREKEIQIKKAKPASSK